MDLAASAAWSVSFAPTCRHRVICVRPFEHPACFAMECCVDELAYALGQDPVALRLANDTDTDVATGLPFSSRYLAECLRRGAELFGWTKRSMAPRSMRAKDGSAIGWGVAVGAYPGLTTPAIAHLKADEDGSVVISIGGHEMGQGIRTALANAVSRKLGVPAEKVTGGGRGYARRPATPHRRLLGHGLRHPGGRGCCGCHADGSRRVVACRHCRPHARLRSSKPPAGARWRWRYREKPRASLTRSSDGSAPGCRRSPVPVYGSHVTFSYIAHFVEVLIEPGTRRIRVPRVVSVADCGRVISPRTAASQVRGGVVWGIGAALRETSEVDPRYGGFLNADLAEYVLPVNADIGSIDVEFIDKPDPIFNRAGAKGLGEVAMTGVAPAIANAVFHATGRRLRDLPIRIEHLL